MGDTLITVVAIGLAAILMFVFPIRGMSEGTIMIFLVFPLHNFIACVRALFRLEFSFSRMVFTFKLSA